jgi:hypothetical protein
MNWIERDTIQLTKLKTKLAINRHMRKWHRDYASQIPSVLRVDSALAAEVIEEMAAEGLLTKEISSRGALVIVYKEAVGS